MRQTTQQANEELIYTIPKGEGTTPKDRYNYPKATRKETEAGTSLH